MIEILKILINYVIDHEILCNIECDMICHITKNTKLYTHHLNNKIFFRIPISIGIVIVNSDLKNLYNLQLL